MEDVCVFLYVFACGALQAEASSAGPAGKQPSRIHLFLDVSCFLLLWIFMDVRVVVGFA